MIIQAILVAGLALCLFYALLQRRKAPYVSLAIAAVSLCGIVFVLSPDWTNNIAHYVGVGRGADLVMYCWLVISFIVSINLQFKILSLQGLVTDLARELALRTPVHVPDDEKPG
jgi:hypothetical protein